VTLGIAPPVTFTNPIRHVTKNYRELEIILKHVLLLVGDKLYTQTDLNPGKNPLYQQAQWPKNQSRNAGEENANIQSFCKVMVSCHILATKITFKKIPFHILRIVI
jgi:hypothetical protein